MQDPKEPGTNERDLSQAPVDPEDALRALLATRGCEDGPQEVLDAARQEAETPADETGEG